MISLRRYKRWCTVFLASLLIGCASGPPASIIDSPPTEPAASSTAPLPHFKHILVIILENKEYDQVIGSSEAPYLNALADQYGLALNYYGITHPSLPNYLALTGGSTFDITTNCTDCIIAQPSLPEQIEAAGKSWKAYMEDMPNPCFVGDAGVLYRQKHNPFIYYKSIRDDPDRCRKIVPFTQFAADLQANALPDFVWITPNMENDSHDRPLGSADAWLKVWVPRILDSPAWREDGTLFITFDEGKGNAGCCQAAAGGHIVTLVVSPLGKPAYRSNLAYDHYSLLRTIEDAWSLPRLAGAACSCAPPMADFFQGTTVGAQPLR